MKEEKEYIELYDLIRKDKHWVRVTLQDSEGQNEDKEEMEVEGGRDQRSVEGKQMEELYQSRTARISSARNLFVIRSLLIVIFVIIVIGVYKLFNIISDRR